MQHIQALFLEVPIRIQPPAPGTPASKTLPGQPIAGHLLLLRKCNGAHPYMQHKG